MIGREADGTVIHNIVEVPAKRSPPHPAVPLDGRLRVALLANYAWTRGSDRLIDVAAVLAARHRRDILFVMAGDMTLRGSLPGVLGRIARAGGTLADYAALRGVADMFLFLGHVPEPESVLAACDLLAKPTRENNPWGRDILEGLAYGLPVITVGRYREFVETGVTGYLFDEFDEAAVADCLLRLQADRALCRRLGAAAQQRVATRCDGAQRAAELAAVWQEAAQRRHRS
jgi:glycosyltransferase involved in cell wall biosynthesis